MMTKIAIIRARGRMGTRLSALAREHECEVVDAVSLDTDELSGVPAVMIDFSTPAATRKWLDVARKRHIRILIGTTGLSTDDHQAIDAAAKEVAVLQSPNMSLGVAVLYVLARRAAELLDGADIDIVEAHHRAKKDAPSGTAIDLAKASGRPGIPIHSLRLGDEVGRHTAYFGLAGERLELAHVATNRDTFAHGALRAAKWLARQKPGRYAISDLLSLGRLDK